MNKIVADSVFYMHSPKSAYVKENLKNSQKISNSADPKFSISAEI